MLEAARIIICWHFRWHIAFTKIEALAKIFTSAQNAMERDLAKTTLADVMEMVKSSGQRTKKIAG
jgi:DNA-binding IscR family transcriptional regulator